MMHPPPPGAGHSPDIVPRIQSTGIPGAELAERRELEILTDYPRDLESLTIPA